MQRVDGKEYGNVQGTNRKKVHEDAALQALDKLCELLTLHSITSIPNIMIFSS